MGNFDFMDCESGSIPCLEMSSVDAETSSGPVPCLLVFSGSKSRETVNLEASTLARSGKSSTNLTSEASFGGYSSVRETAPTG